MPQIDIAQLQLPASHLTTLQRILAQQVPHAEVWAYGSRVKGSAHEGSDLDLVLRQPQALNQPVANGQALLDALQQSSLPILVDVHQWAYLPEAFHTNIQACYIVIQQAEQLAETVC